MRPKASKPGRSRHLPSSSRSLRAGFRLVLITALLLAEGVGRSSAQGVVIPNFWDPRARQDRPDLAGLRTLRFLTDEDYPPLHFAGPDGNPTGFTVEIARAACELLAISCTIQTRRFDTLLDTLRDGGGDVVAAAIPVTADVRRRFAATLPYFRNPGRFVARRDRGAPEPNPRALDGRAVGVVEGTAHEAYLKAFFPRAALKGFAELPAAEAALRRGELDYLFADGVSLALWIGGTEAAGCCSFAGGSYLESRFFGEGIGLVMRKDDDLVRRALEHALQRLWDEGKYAELYLRFFPVAPF